MVSMTDEVNRLNRPVVSAKVAVVAALLPILIMVAVVLFVLR